MGKLEYNNEKSRLGIIENSPSDKLDIRGQQTAVSWLIELIEDHCIRIDEKIIEKAKEMEKEQIITAMMNTFHQENTLPYGMEYLHKRNEKLEGCENYYNETYNK
jgi:hypothetical protein